MEPFYQLAVSIAADKSGKRNYTVLARLVLGFLLFGGASATVAYGRADAWVPHTNKRFGFTFLYPTDIFRMERTAADGDGVIFTSADGGARMLVGALENRDGHTIESYRRAIRSRSYAEFNVQYAPRGHSWFVLSGETADRVFYEKVIFSCGGRIINSFALVYPRVDKALFDPIVERLENSFRAAQDCSPYAY